MLDKEEIKYILNYLYQRRSNLNDQIVQIPKDIKILNELQDNKNVEFCTSALNRAKLELSVIESIIPKLKRKV